MDWFKLMNNPVFEQSRRWRELARIINPYAEYFETPQMRYFKRLERVRAVFESCFADYRDFLEREHLAIKEAKIKPLVKMYKKAIEKEFEVSVQFDDYFFECFGDMPIVEFLENTLNEDFVLEHLLKYAQEKKRDFDRMVRALSGKEIKVERPKFHKFEELFNVDEDFVLVESLLIEWEFLNLNGVLLLNGKEYYKIVAVCDALKHCDIIPKLTDNVLHKLFMVKLGLEYKKLKRSSENFERDKKQYIRDIEKRQSTLKHRKGLK